MTHTCIHTFCYNSSTSALNEFSVHTDQVPLYLHSTEEILTFAALEHPFGFLQNKKHRYGANSKLLSVHKIHLSKM